MITLKNVSFSYDLTPVLNDFSVNIEKNSKICFFGKSGCGKTTLLRLILGLESPTSGEILKSGNLKASVVFQDNLLLNHKSVLDNITLMGADKATALYHLKELGLENEKNSKPSSLSGGMQRRVAIARALANEFDFLVLDEPFTGLDSENVKKTAQHILKVAGSKPIILVTHSLDEASLLNAKIHNL